MTSLPPLDLTVLGTAADGSSSRTYSGDAGDPQDRPTGIQFRTSRFNGFTDGAFVLPRRSDLDHSDIRLLNEYVFSGADGWVAYEGRARDLPRDLNDEGHSIQIALAGWVSHMRDRKFVMVFADRGLWGDMPANRADALSGVLTTGEVSWTNVFGAHVARFPGTAMTAQSVAELWYVAPEGVTITEVQYAGDGSGALTGWVERFAATDNDNGGGGEVYSQTFNGNVQTITLTTARRYVFEQLYANGSAVTPAAGTDRRLAKLAAYGSHGLTLRPALTSGEPDGVYASDVIEWVVANYCPKLNTAGVAPTTHTIGHVAFHERTHPYDVLEIVNRPHLYSFGVWDDRTLHFSPPPDMSDFDWQVRAEDPGVRLRIQGDSTEHLVSGLEVEFTDSSTGLRKTLLPADHDELRDESVDNPFVRAGYPGEATISLGEQCTEDEALEVGRVALAQRNQPRGVGEIDCSHHIRDRAGNWQPVWKVRADHRIAVMSSDNERPRLVGETSYSHDGRSLTIAVDGTLRTPDAILDTLR